MDEDLLRTIRRVSNQMLSDDGDGPFSTAERIAGAFVNDRADWLPKDYQKRIGAALQRLGPQWREAAVEVWSRNYNGRW